MTKHPPEQAQHFRFRKMLWRVRQTGFRRGMLMIKRRVFNPAYLVGLCLWLVGCTLQTLQSPPTPDPTPTPTPQNTPSPEQWEILSPGLERRVYRPSSGFLTQITALRIDPAAYAFRVHYTPGEPKFISEWQTDLNKAQVIVNANFFDSQDRVTGMLFADGVRYGEPYRQRGGTFFINGTQAGIQSNLVQAYQNEQYEQAVQAFPMLITNGRRSYFDTRADRPTRRTVIGVDTSGRVVILVTTFGGLSLLDLAIYLESTDLNLQDALNLDGGGSTMLYAGTPEEGRITLQSFDPVPAVIGVYRR